MQIRLETHNGDLVGTFSVPPFNEVPKVVGWGDRVFALKTEFPAEAVYKEVFAYALTGQPLEATST